VNKLEEGEVLDILGDFVFTDEFGVNCTVGVSSLIVVLTSDVFHELLDDGLVEVGADDLAAFDSKGLQVCKLSFFRVVAGVGAAREELRDRVQQIRGYTVSLLGSLTNFAEVIFIHHLDLLVLVVSESLDNVVHGLKLVLLI